MVPFVANGANAECHRPPRHEPTPIVDRNFVPTDGSSCRLLNGDLGTSPSCWQQWGGGNGPACLCWLCPVWPNSNGQTAYFPMFALFIFAAAYDLSAALTELPVAVRLSAMAAVATRIAPPQITIISTAAMHTLFPRWVKSCCYRSATAMA